MTISLDKEVITYYRGGAMATITFRREQLKALREGLGLSQEAFAEKIGVTKQSVSQWELGQTMPALESLLRVVNATGASLKSFFVEEEGAA